MNVGMRRTVVVAAMVLIGIEVVAWGTAGGRPGPVVAGLPASVGAGTAAFGAPGAAPAPHCFKGAPVSMSASSAYTLLHNTAYDVGYSESRKTPLWSAYHLDWPKPGNGTTARPKMKFKTDDRTEAKITHDDYSTISAVYDRGHMTPSGAIGEWFGKAAQKETFIMSNVCPQDACLNEETWEALERAISQEYAPWCEGVWVTTGPIFEGNVQVVGPGISVPTAFYCIVVDETDDGPMAMAIVMGQSVSGEHAISEFVTTVRDIEQRTQLNFFSQLPTTTEDRVELATAGEEWDTGYVLRPRFRCRK